MLKTSNIKSMAQILRDMKYPPVEEDTDKSEPGTQGDKEEYQKKRKEIANKFGVESCSALKDEEKRKACYAALDAAHVSDDEEEDEDDDPVGKNEEVEVDEKFAGWIAFYNRQKYEIRPKKGEIDSLWDAKQAAIKHFRVPKSKQGLLAVKPAHEEVEIEEGYEKAVLLSLDDAGIDGHFDRGKVVVAKRDVKKAKLLDLGAQDGSKND